MGDAVPLTAAEEDVTLEITAWQAPGSASDPIEEGPYTVSIYLDSDGIGGQQATVIARIPGLQTGTSLRHPLQVSPGQYVFVEVTEENGADNPQGDGDDMVNNDTGANIPDGKRDDLNDSAWTSPIWFRVAPVIAAPVVVWSKNSRLYHDATCWAVAQIGQANRQEGAAPPTDKSMHACTAPNP